MRWLVTAAGIGWLIWACVLARRERRQALAVALGGGGLVSLGIFLPD